MPRSMHLNAMSVKNASRANPAGPGRNVNRALSANLALNALRVKSPRRAKRAPNWQNVRPSPAAPAPNARKPLNA